MQGGGMKAPAVFALAVLLPACGSGKLRLRERKIQLPQFVRRNLTQRLTPRQPNQTPLEFRREAQGRDGLQHGRLFSRHQMDKARQCPSDMRGDRAREVNLLLSVASLGVGYRA